MSWSKTPPGDGFWWIRARHPSGPGHYWVEHIVGGIDRDGDGEPVVDWWHDTHSHWSIPLTPPTDPHP